MTVYPSLYVALARGRDEATFYLSAVRMLFAIVALIVPTILMGGTLPVVSRFVSRQPEQPAQSPLVPVRVQHPRRGPRRAARRVRLPPGVRGQHDALHRGRHQRDHRSPQPRAAGEGGRDLRPGPRRREPAAAMGQDRHPVETRGGKGRAGVRSSWCSGASGQRLLCPGLRGALDACPHDRHRRQRLRLHDHPRRLPDGHRARQRRRTVRSSPVFRIGLPSTSTLVLWFGLTQVVIGLTALLVTVYLRDIPANSIRVLNYFVERDWRRSARAPGPTSRSPSCTWSFRRSSWAWPSRSRAKPSRGTGRRWAGPSERSSRTTPSAPFSAPASAASC
jgi:hypothetical protein